MNARTTPNADDKPEILIIDDDPASIQLMATALAPKYQVTFELSGPDALARIRRGPIPDLILLDVILPGISGYEVCRQLRENTATGGIPVLFITARDDPASEIQALQAGGNDFIGKPINVQVLLLRVDLQLLLRQRERALQALNAELEQRVADRTRALAEALRRAETANRAKSDFLANISHELRTPLNGIIGMTSLLQRDTTNPESCRRLEAVLKSAHDLTRVLGNIIEHARLEANRVMPESKEFSVAALLERLRGRLGPPASAKQLDWSIDLEALPPRLIGAFEQLAQILEQLLDNAVKFTAKGSIKLSATVVQLPGAQLRVSFAVSDTGCGVAPELKTRIFQPFEQADSSTTRQYGGIGLGLAIARQLAQLMQGEVRLEHSDEHGSTFVAVVRLQAPAKPAWREAPGTRSLTREVGSAKSA